MSDLICIEKVCGHPFSMDSIDFDTGLIDNPQNFWRDSIQMGDFPEFSWKILEYREFSRKFPGIVFKLHLELFEIIGSYGRIQLYWNSRLGH